MPPSVTLADVLAADDPLPSPFLEDTHYFVPSGREVRLVGGSLGFWWGEEQRRLGAFTWEGARRLLRAGLPVLSARVAYDTRAGATLPLDSVRVPLSYVQGVPLPIERLVGLVIRRRFQPHCGSAQVCQVLGIGTMYSLILPSGAKAPERERTGLLYLVDSTQLATLEALLQEESLGHEGWRRIAEWWNSQRCLNEAVAELRRGLAA